MVQEVEERVPENATVTPLPRLQLFLTLLVQFAEPITATIIYPFAPRLIRFTGITGGDEKKIGYYAGAVESTFFVSECLTVYLWGRVSDRFGRRPILLLGPLGLAICTIGFGLSTNFWSLILFRGLQGIFNGNIGVSKTVMAEFTDSTNRAQAYTLIPVMWCTGVVVAPMIGGFLVSPAERWPDTLGKIALLNKYPFFLPCLVAGIIAFSSFVLAFLGLKETLPESMRHASHSEHGRLLSDEHNDYGAVSSTVTKPPTLKAIFTPQFIIVLINYGFLAFADMSYEALLPLMYSTSVRSGGLGLDPRRIGSILATSAFTSAIASVLIVAHLIRKYSARRMYICSMIALAFSVSVYPALTFFAKRAGKVDHTVIAFLAVQVVSMLGISPAFSSMQLLVIDSAISESAVASVNSLSQMMATALRAFAPAFSSSLYAATVEYNLLGGYLVYVLLLLIICGGIRVAFLIPKPTPKAA